jgi:hypothetical protein
MLAQGKAGQTPGKQGEAKDKPGDGDKSGPNGAGQGKTKGEKEAKAGKDQPPQPGQPGRGQGYASTPPPPNTPAQGAGQPGTSPKEGIARLFQPESPSPTIKPPDAGTAAGASNVEGPMAGGSSKLGKGGKAPDVDDLDAIADPVEREAARQLQQAVQRIKAARDRRTSTVIGGKGNPVPSGTRRDW